jgi:hypothetical protein
VLEFTSTLTAHVSDSSAFLSPVELADASTVSSYSYSLLSCTQTCAQLTGTIGVETWMEDCGQEFCMTQANNPTALE